jgi:hypothetical protein
MPNLSPIEMKWISVYKKIIAECKSKKMCKIFKQSYSAVYPGSGAFLTPGSGMGKKSGFGSGMDNPDHIPRAEKQFFGLQYLNSQHCTDIWTEG